MLPPTAKDPGVRAPRRGETYRLIGYCVVVGVFGAVAAIAFDAAVELAQRLLLGGIGRYVPPEIIYRNKRGFVMPVGQWLRTELSGSMRLVLLSKSFRDRGCWSSRRPS